MKENVLEVLMYLFENYMIDGSEFQPDQETLTLELAQAGFDHGEIHKAFDWLEDLSVLCEQPMESLGGGQPESVRHYSSEEKVRLDNDAQVLLLSLEQTGILDPAAREMVIDRVMALDGEDIDLEQLRWVIMMVLCNRPDREAVSSWAEDLVLDGIQAHLH